MDKIPSFTINHNLLLRGIEGNVVLLFQTGCGMVSRWLCRQ